MITTKFGDQGQTDLLSQGRVFKDDPYIDTLGTADALTSTLGIAKHHVTDPETRQEIEVIQKWLITIMGEIATKFQRSTDLSEAIHAMEAAIKRNETLYPQIHGFVIPGEHLSSSYLDLARVKAREVERRIIHLMRQNFHEQTNGMAVRQMLETSQIVPYFNRLSDYLYSAARREAFRQEVLQAVGEQVTNYFPIDAMTLALAKVLAEDIELEAKRQGLQVVIAIVNSEGNPILVHRMEEAFSISFNLARKKAYTAAALKMPTHELAKLTAKGADFEGLHDMLDEEIVTLGGGFPLMIGNKVIGALAVSGSTVDNDQGLAAYGVSCFINRINEKG